MLQIPGYVPIHHLALRTQYYLKWRLLQWHESRREAGASPQLPLSKHAILNLEGIAERIAISVVWANGGMAYLLSGSGSTVQIDLRLVDLRHKPAYQQLFDHKWFDNLVDFKIISLDAFSGDDWQEAVVNSRIYELGSPGWGYKIIDWQHGIIDVSYLMEEHLGNESAGAQKKERGVNGIDRLRVDNEGRFATGKLAMFMPYHGCPVLVPLKWKKALEAKLDTSAKDFEDVRALPPVERILAYLTANPGARKESVARAVFPNMSGRWFQHYWKQASERRPELSKPGRKRKS